MDNNNSTNNNFDNLENNNSFNNMVDNLGNSNNESNIEQNINTYSSNLSSNLNNNDSGIVSESIISNNFNNNINSSSRISQNVDNNNNISNYDTNNNINKTYSNNYKRENKNNTGLYIVIIILVALVIYLGITLIFNKSNSKGEYKDSDIVIEYDKGNIIKSELYDAMLKQYSVSILLDMVDNNILNPMYPETGEMKKSINETYDSYINYYKQSGYTEESFLEGNGFKDKEDFLDVLRLDYRRGKYLDEYIKKNISSVEINDYYNKNIFGDIDSKHILVKVNDPDGEYSYNDNEAKELANEIIDKLNNGKAFDEVKEEYKDIITYEELGYLGIDAGLESAYMEEMKNLKVGEYSKIPVKTTYGYHIVYKIDQKEKPNIEEAKDKILNILSEEKKDEDPNLLYKSLIELRKENNVIFKDKDLKEKYENYINTIK